MFLTLLKVLSGRRTQPLEIVTSFQPGGRQMIGHGVSRGLSSTAISWFIRGFWGGSQIQVGGMKSSVFILQGSQ